MIFYVYVYLREDGSPYYVGKGKGVRWRRKHNVEVPPEERVLFFITDTTDEWACYVEMWLIDYWGRLNDGTGILENLTDGGETTTGNIPTEETKRKISQSLKGQRLSEEHKRKIGESGKGRKHKPESIQKMKKPKTEEHKRKIGEGRKGKGSSLKGKKQSEEIIRKRSASMKGRKKSEETKRKISESKKGKKMSVEVKMAQSKRKKGNKWWNRNGVEKCCKNWPGEGWVDGRKKK